ncbi:MAG: hypothetical protein ACLPIX_06065 [Rhodomicrobium sp.]
MSTQPLNQPLELFEKIVALGHPQEFMEHQALPLIRGALLEAYRQG